MKQELIIDYTESAPIGKKIYADIPGRKRERIGIIGGWIGKRFIAPMTFKGGCDKEVFNTWLEKMLLPKLPHVLGNVQKSVSNRIFNSTQFLTYQEKRYQVEI